jgi:hypothetical protein
VTYDLVRGDLDRLSALAHSIDLGPTTCLASNSTSVRWSCDGDPLPSGRAFFYLARVHGATDWGRGSGLTPRGSSAECP